MKLERPWVLVPLLGLIVILTGFTFGLLLDANQGYTRLSLERSGTATASAIWDWFSWNLKKATPPPSTDPGTNNDGDDLPGNFGAANLSELTKSLKDQDILKQFRDIEGWGVYTRSGLIFAGDGNLPGELPSLLAEDKNAEQLPFGDRIVYLGSDRGVLYIRSNGPRGGLDHGGRGHQEAFFSLALWMKGESIYAESRSRTLALVMLTSIELILVGLLFAAQLRMSQLRKHLETQRALAGIGAATRTLAHEIRNPLSIVMMQARMLRSRGTEDTELTDGLKTIESEVQRIDGTIRWVKSLMERGAGHQAPHSLAALCHAVFEAFPVERERIFPEGPHDISVSVDAAHFRSILINLIRNAFEAGSQRVWVTWKIEGAQASVFVDDEAGGLSPAARKHLFEAFFTTKTEGSGIGLSLSRDLARASGGDLVYTTLPAQEGRAAGSRFVLSLPVQEQA